MKIAVIGTGYVGLVTGVCFSEMGNEVVCVDIDKKKIEGLSKGIVPIYEPGLKELIDNNLSKNLFFSVDIQKAIQEVSIIFIAVGTPMKEDGTADLSSVFEVAKVIGKTIGKRKIIVSKSTVPVGTTIKIKEIIKSELEERSENIDFHVVSNPEFLKEGAAINDFMKPDRVVIGAEDQEVFSKMKQLYSPFFRTHDRFITMDIASAEMTKYAANAMLATKISFINEMANICERVGADINNVRVGIGSDKRIGYDFIYPGIGYGGTCFPKDISALIHLGRENGYIPELISSVDKVNKAQKKLFLNKVLKKFGEDLSGITFAIWGLAFKPETDDMREAPSVYVVEELIKKGGRVKVYDPKAIEQAKNKYFATLDVFYGMDKYEVLEKADALLLLTEWKEFRSPDFEKMKQLMNNNTIFDARNQYDVNNLHNKNIEYYSIGK
ncbi:UDP-glucose 6-dehydrogenase [Tenacibaculum maritimum]|uniref:UDP-glucose dehydrogenase family protein n=1 Tax=Tenacibaculum maritimum TaxID=107401 RepID=UPI0012E65CB7|nr:UDP-glucose/GDP-mannose dehydrogenase family protein [Tenacibaculum maritimum]CAA0219264.1 UDP-glucose 6-dehydrogenase [Tenacibaculum maritimum]CAA0255259.1 UDP-glucose 6-dehydrogenase [Tenacibaculum maritimum]CAA0260168.1 UDP-glucose 6-dehydrogenase [Tenacibaculum maritimum]